jgi:hypothetical protein
MNLDPRTIVGIMGGAVTGRDSCNVPGPGHSKGDQSLSIRIDQADPLGFKVHSFAGDDWQVCRDYVAAALGLKDETLLIKQQGRQRLEPSRNFGKVASDSPLQLFHEAINA